MPGKSLASLISHYYAALNAKKACLILRDARWSFTYTPAMPTAGRRLARATSSRFSLMQLLDAR